MPAEQVADITPFLRELLNAPKEQDWCVSYVSSLDEDAWIQLIRSSINLSMNNARLDNQEVKKEFLQLGFVCEEQEYQEGEYLTLAIDWSESLDSLSRLIDHLFTHHLRQPAEYGVDCEMYEIELS